MDLILQVFYSVFSGVILSLAIPNEFFNFGMPLFTIFALFPFYLALKSSKTYKRAFLYGFIQTTTTHLFSSFWLAYFKDFAVFTLGASAAGTGVIGGVFGLFLYIPFAEEKNRNRLNEYSYYFSKVRNPAFYTIYFAIIYTLYEWVKSTGFLGYPWGTLSSTMYKWPVFTQVASVTGAYGVTFLFALLNAALSELFLLYKTPFYLSKNYLFSLKVLQKFLLVLFSVVVFFGIYQLNKKRIPQKILTAVMVQQNSDPWKEKTDTNSILRSQNLTLEAIKNLSEDNKKADLVVWSEGCLKRSFPRNGSSYSYLPSEKPLYDFIREINIPLLAGGSYFKDYENRIVHNAALVFDKKGHLRGYYGKNHLVPFAEALPGREFPAIRSFMKKTIGISAGWTPGDQYTYFDIPCEWYENRKLPPVNIIDLSKTYEEQSRNENLKPTVRISTPICFDDSFADVMRPMFNNGAELFMNITDDSWSLKKSSEYQHFSIAHYASIEYRTTMVRSSNSGYSAVISPTGKVLFDQPLFKEYSLACDIPVYQREVTTYARFGNWLPYSSIIFLFIYSIYSFLIFKTSDYIPSERKIKKGHKKHKHKK